MSSSEGLTLVVVVVEREGRVEDVMECGAVSGVERGTKRRVEEEGVSDNEEGEV